MDDEKKYKLPHSAFELQRNYISMKFHMVKYIEGSRVPRVFVIFSSSGTPLERRRRSVRVFPFKINNLRYAPLVFVDIINDYGEKKETRKQKVEKILQLKKTPP